MGVYIKGMEMPKNCADCLLGLTDQREVNRKITNAQKFKQIFHISVEEVQPKDLSWWQEEYKDEIQV